MWSKNTYIKYVCTFVRFSGTNINVTVFFVDETYTKLTQLFQGYIVNEVDLNRDSSCRENCGYYAYSKVHGCFKNQYCSQQRKCNGKILNCEYIDSDMWICPAVNSIVSFINVCICVENSVYNINFQAKNSERRYEYIEYENGRVYGEKKACTRGTSKVDSWWRWLFWHCSYCFCYCDDNHANSDRYVSLQDVVSDVANNK